MKKRCKPDDSNQLTRYLWVGSADECRQIAQMTQFDWIISVDFNPDEGYPKSQKRHFQMFDLSSLRDKRKVEDTRQTMIHVISLLVEIIERKETVFLHCQVGQSRSISIAIAYIMVAFKKTSLEAQKYVFYHRQVSRVKRELLIIAEKAAETIPIGENGTPDELFESSGSVDPKDFIVHDGLLKLWHL